MTKKACLVLADGHELWGVGFGNEGCVIGEAVFTTGMCGYIETLTDPSFFGQIVCQTFPLIGNYGKIRADAESGKIHVRGYVVREWCKNPSNFRCEGDLDSWLKEQNVIALSGIDTRSLTKILRESGVMNGMIISGDSKEALEAFDSLKNAEKKARLLEKIRAYKITKAVEAVTKSADDVEKDAETVFRESAAYRAVPVRADGTKETDSARAMEAGRGKKVVLFDFGAKANIRRELLKRGLFVEAVSAQTSATEILSKNPDGIMLSNGPGDPAENTQIIEEIRSLIKSGIPIFGICLGHQLLALAKGAKTAKLKYGHRGGNQPVKYCKNGRVYISSQNHGYAVENSSLPKNAVLSFVNTNDGTCEGIVYTDIPAFSVQFHPEASSGPQDTSFLFDEFVRLINNPAYFKDFKAEYARVDAIATFGKRTA